MSNKNLTEKEKVDISSEVLKILKGKIQIYGLPFTPAIFEFGMDMFQAGVSFIPNKIKNDR